MTSLHHRTLQRYDYFRENWSIHLNSSISDLVCVCGSILIYTQIKSLPSTQLPSLSSPLASSLYRKHVYVDVRQLQDQDLRVPAESGSHEVSFALIAVAPRTPSTALGCSRFSPRAHPVQSVVLRAPRAHTLGKVGSRSRAALPGFSTSAGLDAR